MKSNAGFRLTSLVAITEDGLVEVYERTNRYYTRSDRDDMVVYEWVDKSAVMTKSDVEDKYPEMLV